MKKMTRFLPAALSALALLLLPLIAAASDGAINQDVGHGDDVSMYRYDIDLYLYNPCNSGDMDDDAVYQLWFDFGYRADNGYGAASTYRYDLSWDKGKKRNLNAGVLRENFIRPNDNACMTRFSVWVPGIVNTVKVHLNMDGGERLAFTVESISLNGYRINTNTDYVSSAYYDSDATVTCRAPRAAIVTENGTVDRSAPVRDQYGGVFTDRNTDKALEDAAYGDPRMLYHYRGHL